MPPQFSCVPLRSTSENCAVLPCFSDFGCFPTAHFLTFPIWLRRALEIAGIDRHPYPKQLRGVCVHCLRHTFAVHTLQLQSKRGIDRFYSVPILSTYMGHTDIYGTELYLRLTPECYEHIVDCAEKDTGDIFPEVLP